MTEEERKGVKQVIKLGEGFGVGIGWGMSFGSTTSSVAVDKLLGVPQGTCHWVFNLAFVLGTVFCYCRLKYELPKLIGEFP